MANKFGIAAVIDGISRKLDGSFDNVAVYADENVEQGLEPPAFFIAALSPSRSPELGARYRSRNPFDIHYFPTVDGNNTEMLGVAERLYEVLAYITVDDKPVRGTNMSYELADRVLHFFVAYNLTGKTALPEVPEMTDITLKAGTKE